MALKKLFKKAKKTVKKVQKQAKESTKAKEIEQFFKKEGGKYIPHGLKSEQGKVFPGQPKEFANDKDALAWAKRMHKQLVRK